MPSTTETVPHTIISFPVTRIVCVTSASRNAHCLGKACLGKIINYLLIQRPLLLTHNRQRREQFWSLVLVVHPRPADARVSRLCAL